MKTIEINGIVYEIVPAHSADEDLDPCHGCAGNRDYKLCDILPEDCLEESIIWKKKCA